MPQSENVQMFISVPDNDCILKPKNTALFGQYKMLSEIVAVIDGPSVYLS
jgi:hypothetical protein